MAKREERDIISLVGRTNVGKSSLLNLLSGQKEYAIVDATPGTTTDTVIAPMEIHDLGPVKLLDTAGVDENTALGAKKRKKTLEAIEEADLSLVVMDLKLASEGDALLEQNLIRRALEHQKQALVVYNIFDKKLSPKIIGNLQKLADKKLNSGLPSIAIRANNLKDQQGLIEFIKKFYQKKNRHVDLLPGIAGRGFVLLVIPMDEETPALRLLRPQDMAVERLLRNFTVPVLFRPDLFKARSADPKTAAAEKKRFADLVRHLIASGEGLRLIITDSQAFDVISAWTPKHIPLTSFSIMMTHYMSGGNLKVFLDGVKAVRRLKNGDPVLIAEACNHDRKCDDIGTVQIPRLLQQKTGKKFHFEFNFGRPFPEDLKRYKLIVHCGACMIDRQKYLRRIRMAKNAGVPITNYGILLSYLQGEEVLRRGVSCFSVDLLTQLI